MRNKKGEMRNKKGGMRNKKGGIRNKKGQGKRSIMLTPLQAYQGHTVETYTMCFSQHHDTIVVEMHCISPIRGCINY